MGLKIGFMEVGLVKIWDKYNNSPRKRKFHIVFIYLFFFGIGRCDNARFFLNALVFLDK